MAGTTPTSCSPCVDCNVPTTVACPPPAQYTANTCPDILLTDCVTYSGVDNTCIGVTSSGTPMTLTQALMALLSYLSNIWTRITSNSLSLTTSGPCANVLTVELVPSSQIGNILILGNDGKPFVPQSIVNLSGSKCISFQNTGTAQNALWVPVLDFNCISNNITIPAINCTAPSSVTIGNITTTTASVSFATNIGNMYDIILNGTVIATNIGSPYNFTGLTPATNYSVIVRCDCVDGNTSETLLAFSTTPILICNTPSNLQITSI